LPVLTVHSKITLTRTRVPIGTLTTG